MDDTFYSDWSRAADHLVVNPIFGLIKGLLAIPVFLITGALLLIMGDER